MYMGIAFVWPLLALMAAALFGGILARLLRIQTIIGYILGGMVVGAIFPVRGAGIENLSEIGAILLLFSVGIELSLAKLSKVIRIATVGTATQIFLVTLILYFFLKMAGLPPLTSLILSLGFSLSSTAVIVKILSEKGELDTTAGEVMIGWALVQDLATVPMIVLLPVLTQGTSGAIFWLTAKALFLAAIIVAFTVFLGRLAVPFLIHRIASVNSRELLLLAGLTLALGVAALSSLFGISAPLGAFLAGVVISESQENHAIFAETRPLRDLFVALFFVTLGFLINLNVVIANFWLILGLAGLIIIIKFLVVFGVSSALGYHGKVAITSGIGLAQVGEFSFLIFSIARGLSLISGDTASLGITVGLVTLIFSPFLFPAAAPFWRKLKTSSLAWPKVNKFLMGWDRRTSLPEEALKSHIIIVGYGRVGGWVGRALGQAEIPYVVIDYNQRVVNRLKGEGTSVIYGDPTEPEILDVAGIKDAKAIVLAIPDHIAQVELATYVQTIAPDVKIIGRAHLDEDWEKLKILKVDKVVQPEFEAAVAIIRSIFATMGKSKEEVTTRVKNLRLSKAMS